jgi:hypothetical protein
VGIVLQVPEQSARTVVGRGALNMGWDAAADQLAGGVAAAAAGELCSTVADVEDVVAEVDPVGSGEDDAARRRELSATKAYA